MRLVGHFSQFRLKVDKQTNQPKGYGFCEYLNRDLAASALRNLNRFDLNKRELKVDFASDNKNGTNLRPPDVLHRDLSEPESIFAHINKTSIGGIGSEAAHTSAGATGDLPLPSCSSADALLNLSIRHQILLIFGLKQVYEDMVKRKDTEGIEDLKLTLAFTGADGIEINPEELQPHTNQSGKKDMLTVIQTMVANVRKAIS